MRRGDVERALDRCDYLSPAARAVLMALLSRADHSDGAIPPRFAPTIPALMRRTGLGRSTVYTALAHLGGRCFSLRGGRVCCWSFGRMLLWDRGFVVGLSGDAGPDAAAGGLVRVDRRVL